MSNEELVAYKMRLYLELTKYTKDVLGTRVVSLKDITKVFNSSKIVAKDETTRV